MYKQLLALSTLSGTIIGVGLFGLPYVTSKIGFWPMILYFILLGTVMIAINFMYGEITLRTRSLQRLPGYAQLYLNKFAMAVVYMSTIIGLVGALLAYIVIGGGFLYSFLAPFLGGVPLTYATIFFVCGALLIFAGSGAISKTEFFSMGLFFVILCMLFYKAIPYFNFTNFNHVDLQHFFLPYGVILFSISGIAVVPEIKEILKGEERRLKSTLLIGLLIPIITYIVFIITVFGVTGLQTTQEAMAGLNAAVGNGVVSLGFLFGIITTFTSFITLGVTLRKELHYDCRLPNWLAWVLSCIPAYALYLLGVNDFISIIGFVGSIALGIDVVVIGLIYLRMKKKTKPISYYKLNFGLGTVAIITLLFITGIILEIKHLF